VYRNPWEGRPALRPAALYDYNCDGDSRVRLRGGRKKLRRRESRKATAVPARRPARCAGFMAD